MRLRKIPRERYDEVLEWIQLRVDGHTSGAIAAMYDTKSAVVRTSTNKARIDDEKQAGRVLGGYWS